MRLSRNEIRARAANFAREWADAVYEKGETRSFYNDFFEIFGKRRRDVPQYEEHVQRLDNRSVFIDLFRPLVLLVERDRAAVPRRPADNPRQAMMRKVRDEARHTAIAETITSLP